MPVRLLNLSRHYTSQRTIEPKSVLPPPVDSVFASLVHDHMSLIKEVGWVHGDVKPSNILISSDGNVWLSDFGSAVRATELCAFLRGTPRY